MSQHSFSLGRFMRWSSLFLLLGVAVSCNARAAQMIPEYGPAGRHAATVSVDGTSNSLSAMWISCTVTGGAYEDAVAESIKRFGVFEAVVDEKEADYRLEIVVDRAISHPGANMNAWVDTTWKLYEKGEDEEVWSREFKTKGHAYASEYFSGAHRQRLAMERAGVENVGNGLSALARASLSRRRSTQSGSFGSRLRSGSSK